MNAAFLLRLKAFLFDYILIFCYLLVLFALNMLIFPALQQFFNGSLVVAQLAGFLMVTLPVSLYFAIGDSVWAGQSFGKKKTGIRVVNLNGTALSLPRSLFRTALKFLPWELSHYLVYRLVHIGDGCYSGSLLFDWRIDLFIDVRLHRHGTVYEKEASSL